MKIVCQSCAMPLDQDPQGGGSNTDGTKSLSYCSYCYRDGAFTSPDFTVQQMQEFCVQKLCERGVVKPLAWLMTRGIPKLKRWNAKQAV